MYGIFPHVATLMHEAGETRASIAGIVLAGFGMAARSMACWCRGCCRGSAKPP
ncbi:MAG: hypothetical protein WDN48_14585 [Pseudolabrys sp.]